MEEEGEEEKVPRPLPPPPVRLLTARSMFQLCDSRKEKAKPSSSVPAIALKVASFSSCSATVEEEEDERVHMGAPTGAARAGETARRC